jgi:hypothetical protein
MRGTPGICRDGRRIVSCRNRTFAKIARMRHPQVQVRLSLAHPPNLYEFEREGQSIAGEKRTACKITESLPGLGGNQWL